MSWTFWKLVVPLALVAVCVALGTWGFLHSELRVDGGLVTLTTWEAFWLATGLPVLETTNYPGPGSTIVPSLDLARGLGLLVPPYAFFVILSSLIGDGFKFLKLWWWRHLSRRSYVVVLGLGWIGNEIVQDLVRGDRCNVLAIDKVIPDASDGKLNRKRTIFLQGDATAARLLERIGVSDAKKVFVVCADDEINCLVVDQIVAVCNPTRGRSPGAGASSASQLLPKCYVHIVDPRKHLHLARMRHYIPALSVRCFNTYDTTARRVYFERPNFRFASVSRESVLGQTVRLVIVGYTPMGKALLLRCLRSGHFRQGQQQEIVVLAENAAACEREFLAEFPCLRAGTLPADRELQSVCAYTFPGSLPIRFVEMPQSDSELLRDDFVLCERLTPDVITSIYICLDDGLGSAGYVTTIAAKIGNLLAARQGEGGRDVDCHLYLYYNIPREQQKERTNFVREVLEAQRDKHVTLHVFGDLMESVSVGVIEARELDRRASQMANFFAKLYGGDRWDDLVEDLRESNRQAADHIAVKLRCFGLTEESVIGACCPEFETHEPELAEMEHRRWCAEKLLDGWLPLSPSDLGSWAEGKGVQKAKKAQKRHRDLVPFDQLPASERGKDLKQVRFIPACVRNELAIGVTGHRFLAEVDRIERGIDTALERIQQAFPAHRWAVVSALAEGADRIAAHRILELPSTDARGPVRLRAPLPLPRDEYLKDFESEDSKVEFGTMLEAAAEVAEPDTVPEDRARAYERVGADILERADVLLAIWDGRGAQGQGGTGAVVAVARKKGLPIAWVHAGNRRPGTEEPTSLGAAQGTVTFENFR